jgi:hypothetical protein
MLTGDFDLHGGIFPDLRRAALTAAPPPDAA